MQHVDADEVVDADARTHRWQKSLMLRFELATHTWRERDVEMGWGWGWASVFGA